MNWSEFLAAEVGMALTLTLALGGETVGRPRGRPGEPAGPPPRRWKAAGSTCPKPG